MPARSKWDGCPGRGSKADCGPRAAHWEQVCSALGQVAKHSVDLAEVVVEAEIFPKILTCLKDVDTTVRKHAATCIREARRPTLAGPILLCPDLGRSRAQLAPGANSICWQATVGRGARDRACAGGEAHAGAGAARRLQRRRRRSGRLRFRVRRQQPAARLVAQASRPRSPGCRPLCTPAAEPPWTASGAWQRCAGLRSAWAEGCAALRRHHGAGLHRRLQRDSGAGGHCLHGPGAAVRQPG